ncbi:MAG: AsmA-like C-terminal region-containing protein, partial [Paracoccaceae bacterium]|nr:AsmA-like C-terminal region-containing protein [Paracoccaceae bacterium]
DQSFTVAASGRADGLFSASFNGPVSMGDAPAAKGSVKVQISDLRAFAEWASGNALDAPAGTFESAGAEASLAMRGDRIDLSGLELNVDQTRLSGDGALDMGGRPYLSANLNSGPVDLTPFMGPAGGSSGGGGGSGGAQGWSTEPLDLSALRALDADLAIRAESVDLGDIEIGRSDIDARLRDGRLDMRIDRVDAYGGGMSGDIVLIAGDQAEVATDLTVSQVQLRPLLQALAGFDNLEGIGAFRINARGRGGSMDQLMRSLDGNGGLDLSDGAILGVNLAAMVRNLTGQTDGVQRTDFSAVTGTFDITDGVLHNSDFSFLGPLLRVVGAGTVDLGAQTQDFRLEPTAVASLTGQGGALGDSGLGVFPVLITGTWSNPKIRPDLTAAIEGFLSDPERTIGTVGELVKDPGKAVGALLGQTGGDQDEGGGVLGQVLDGALGGSRDQAGGDSVSPTEQVLGSILGSRSGSGQDQQGGGSVEQPTYEQESGSGGAIGTLLGALGGKRGGDEPAPIPQATEPEETVPQPTYNGGTAETGAQTGDLIGGSALAPARAPYPPPAPRTAALDQGNSLPAQQFEPEPEAEPEPQRPADILQDILQPEQESTGTEAEGQGRRDKKRIKVKDLLKILK